MKIEHISISRESTFSQCQQLYKFKYHLQMASPEPEPIYFMFGKIIHRIIEEHTKGKGKDDIASITKKILTGKIELEPGKKAKRLDADYQNKLIRMLGHYRRMVEKIGYDGVIEWKFTIDMDGKGRKMTGFIDRLILKENGDVFLLDYKTTKPGGWRKNDRTIGKDLQLQCYAYVVSKHFNIPAKNIEVALFYLDDNKIIPTKFSDEVIKSVPERLLSAYKEIEELDADKVYGNVGKHCHRCDYRKVCPFWALT